MAVLEVGIAGWALGHGLLWLGAMTAAVTLADCGIGVVHRRSLADVAGFELGVVLVALLVRPAGTVLVVAVAAACAAWLIRPQRYEQRAAARL